MAESPGELAAARIAETLASIKGRLEILRAIEGADLPANLKEARERAAILAVDLGIIEFELKYPEDEARQDAMRVMPVSAARRVIDELEERLIQEHVLRPKQLIERRVVAAKRIATAIKDDGDAVAGALLRTVGRWVERLTSEEPLLYPDEEAGLIRSLAAIWAVMAIVWEVLSVDGLRLLVVRIAEARHAAIDAARKRALPQRGGSRVFRRKESRL